MKQKTTIVIIVIIFLIAGMIDFNRFYLQKKVKNIQAKIEQEGLVFIRTNTEIYGGYHSEKYQLKDQYLRIETGRLSYLFENIELIDLFDTYETLKEIKIWKNHNDRNPTIYYVFDDLEKNTYTLILTDYKGKEYKKNISLKNDNISIEDEELMDWLNQFSDFKY